VLRNNGGGDLAVSAAGAFTFAARVNAGAAYAVTVATQPAGQTCSVANGSGTASAQVSNVNVSCVDVPLAFDPAAAFQVDQPLPTGTASNAEEVATATHPTNGTSLLVYTQRGGQGQSGSYNVFARVLAADGSPGEQLLIGQPNGLNASALRVKYGPNGKAVAIWTQAQPVPFNSLETDILASVYANGQWSAATRVAKTSETNNLSETAAAPDLAFDDAGNAIAVWSEQINFGGASQIKSAFFNDATSTWAEPNVVVTTLNGSRNVRPRVAMLASAPKPEFLVVMLRTDVFSTLGTLAARRCAIVPAFVCQEAGVNGGAFLPITQGGLAPAQVEYFNMASSAAGDVVVAWRQLETTGRRNLAMTSRSAGAGEDWRPAQFVTGPEGVQPSFGNVPNVPEVHVATGGGALLAWSQSDPHVAAANGVFVGRFTPTATGPLVPTAPVAFASKPSDSVSLTVTEAGKALLLWTRPVGLIGSNLNALFSSAFDATATALMPGPEARVGSAEVNDIFPVAVSRGADGKGVAAWIEVKLLENGEESKVMANRYN
jgi:hypothetical protein